ncbi:MAG: hypothetical protein IJ160_11175 [Muribaculaceae bacterium]|nr:hypothetical protein [Muribaculaceae bacterium]
MLRLAILALLALAVAAGDAREVTVYMSAQPDGKYVTPQGDVLQLLVRYPHSYLMANGGTILHSSGENGTGMVYRYRAADECDRGVVIVDRKSAGGKWEAAAFSLDGECLIDFAPGCWDITRKRDKRGKIVMRQRFMSGSRATQPQTVAGP